MYSRGSLAILFLQIFAQSNGFLTPITKVYTIPIRGENLIDHVNVDTSVLESLGRESRDDSENEFDGALRAKMPYYGKWIKNFYLPMLTSSEECQAAINDLEQLGAMSDAKKIVDSWGKWPDGFLWGNHQPLGMFEECLDVKNEDFDFQGRYCFVMVLKTAGSSTGSSNRRIANPEPRTGFVFPTQEVPFPYNYGTCIPDKCNSEDMKESLDRVFSGIDYARTADVYCHRLREEEVDLTGGDISLITFLSVMGFLLLLASIFDIYTVKANKKELRNSTMGRITMTFSFYTNFRRLFAVSSKHSKDAITCLYGMRVITLLWIMWGHQYLFPLFYITENTADLDNKTDDLWYMVIANATFSVDTFFFMSGLLVCISAMRMMERNRGRLNILWFYIHRYIRLTPALALAVWYQATIMRLFIHGPISFYQEQITESCSRNWWSYLVYVNNFVVDTTDPYDSLCLEHAWYTAVDMQIYVLSPLVLIPLYHFKKWGKVLLAFLIFAEGLVAGIVTVALDLPAFDKINAGDQANYSEYSHIIYVDPFLRCGPYLVGIAIGYFIYKNTDKRIKFKYWQLVLGWILSLGTMFAIIFGIYRLFKTDNLVEDETSPGVQFFYGGYSRTIWAIAVAWIVIVCYYGYGGPVNTILSHEYFQPLSRLTFTLYLFSLGILYALIWSTKIPYYFNHINKIIETAGTFIITFWAALMATLLIEYTTVGLEKETLVKWMGRGSKAKSDPEAAN